VEERKKELRKQMRARRANNENRDVKERLLVENFFTVLKGFWGEGKKKICCYLSYSSEASTDLLIENLIEAGYEVYCPRVSGEEMETVAYGEDFTISPLRIREPVGEAYQGEVDVIVTPFLAVDKQGNRLGYGGGYYDRYFQVHPMAKRVAYGFDFQIQPQVPTLGFDEKVDCIVTDKQIIYIER